MLGRYQEETGNVEICSKKVMLFLKRREKGSYTVEAAFIVPIILGLVFVILYTMFLLHDKAMLQANLDNVIFLLAEGEKIEKQEYDTYLSHAVWFADIQQIKVKNGKMAVSGTVKASVNLDIPVLTYFVKGKQEFTLSESYYKIQPELIIRYGEGIIKQNKD